MASFVNEPLIPRALATAMPISDRLVAVDSLRALAALMVYFYHAWQCCGSPALTSQVGSTFAVGDLINTFPAGVDLFMVLSGFCLFWPTARKPAKAASWSWWNFAKRRVERIVPPYYASIAFVTILPLLLVAFYHGIGKPAKWQALPSLTQYLTHLFFVHTWHPQTWAGIQGVYWSLGLEVQFYLVFPLVIWGFQRMGIRVVWYMAGISLIYRVVAGILTMHSPWVVGFLWSITFLGRWMEFAAGMFAAWVVARAREGEKPAEWRLVSLLALSIGAYVLAMEARGLPGFLPARDLLLSVSFACVLIGTCAARTRLSIFFEWKPLAALGLISYSLFLIHQNLAFFLSECLFKVFHMHGATEFLGMSTVGLAGIIAFAFLFFKAFEAPFLRQGSGGKCQQPRLAAISQAGPASGFYETDRGQANRI